MKRIMTLLLLAAMLLSLCACGEAPVTEEQVEAVVEAVEEVVPGFEEVAAQAEALLQSGEFEALMEALAQLEGSELQLADEIAALCSYNGYGTEIDAEAAVEMLEPLAQAGSCIANYLMGKASFSGNGTVQNPEKSQEYFKQAFAAAESMGADDSSLSYGLLVLAECYTKGLGVEKDVEKAFDAARRAVEEAGLSAFESFELGNLLKKNADNRQIMVNAILGEHGIELDDMKLKLEELKALPELSEDQQTQIQAFEQVLQQLDLQTQAETLADKAFDAAVAAIEKLAAEGNIIALKYMGDYYFGALGSREIDYAKAMDYYMQAADFDYAPAQAQIALMYQDGLGVDVSYELAMEWNNRAAQQGNAQGQAQIGYLYHMGLGVTQNLNEAGRWYSRAADQGDEWAAEKLKETELTNPQLAFEFHA